MLPALAFAMRLYQQPAISVGADQLLLVQDAQLLSTGVEGTRRVELPVQSQQVAAASCGAHHMLVCTTKGELLAAGEALDGKMGVEAPTMDSIYEAAGCQSVQECATVIQDCADHASGEDSAASVKESLEQLLRGIFKKLVPVTIPGEVPGVQWWLVFNS